METKKNFNMKDVGVRIFAILILGILIWNLVTFLSETFFGEEYSSLKHFLAALITTGLTVTVIQIALKMDQITWKHLGQSTVKRNIFSFMLGFFLWTIPATIGLFMCIGFGWVEIKVHTDMNSILLSLVILFLTVFLIEALPEELFFRGYIYRFLNVVLPHWGVLILQAGLFSLFAFFIGAMYSVEQLQFIPGFAVILGIFRAISGSMWTSIGFHVAIMTATQILGPFHGHFDVGGIFTLRFFAFILLPSVVGAVALSFIYPNFKWSKKEPLI